MTLQNYHGNPCHMQKNNCTFVLRLSYTQVQDTNATVIPATGLNAIASRVVYIWQ